MIKKIFCKLSGHVLINAGSCPFTRKTYKACSRCGKMVVVG